MKRGNNSIKNADIFFNISSSKTSKNLVGKGLFTGAMMDDSGLKSCLNSKTLAYIQKLNIEVQK